MEDTKTKGFFDFRIIIGLLIVAAGVLLLLDTLGYDIRIDVWDFWPVLLIAIGLKKILDPKGYRQIYWGLVILLVGVLFQLNNLGYLDFDVADLWPILLILVGVEVIKTGWYRKGIKADPDKEGHKFFAHFSPSRSVESDYIHVSAILGGGEYNFTNKKLKGGSISAIMGGCELDLRNADMEGDTLILDTFALMGGIDLRVPGEWAVVMQGTPILGAMEDKSRPVNGVKKQLIIKGTAIMGAVEVKN